MTAIEATASTLTMPLMTDSVKTGQASLSGAMCQLVAPCDHSLSHMDVLKPCIAVIICTPAQRLVSKHIFFYEHITNSWWWPRQSVTTTDALLVAAASMLCCCPRWLLQLSFCCCCVLCCCLAHLVCCCLSLGYITGDSGTEPLHQQVHPIKYSMSWRYSVSRPKC